MALHPTVADEVDSRRRRGACGRRGPGHPMSNRDPRAGRRRERRDRRGPAARGHPVRGRRADGPALPARGVDLVSVLEVVDDVTANGAMLRLLTGPRWHIGPRDLALLGRRARALAGVLGCARASLDVDEQLGAVEGADPTEVVSSADAVEDPGDLPYSPRGARAVRRGSAGGCDGCGLARRRAVARVRPPRQRHRRPRRRAASAGVASGPVRTRQHRAAARRDRRLVPPTTACALSGLLAYLRGRGA